MSNLLLMSTEGATGMTDIITKLTTGVEGVFTIAGQGFNFITGNDLCMFMVAISFAGVALGFVKRAFKTARK